MEENGKWTKDSEGYMDFDPPQLQRFFEVVTDQFYNVYNRYLDEMGDEELASAEARKEGYKMITDYKEINGNEEFATSYITPYYEMDMWYEMDPVKNKRVYDKGFIRVRKKNG